MTTVSRMSAHALRNSLWNAALFVFLSLAIACGDRATAPDSASVAKVVVEPANVSLAEGETKALVAVAKDAAGRVLAGKVAAWSSSAPSIVTVDGSGHLTAVTAGKAEVTATIEGHSATAAVTVNRAAVASIVISPAPLVLEIGEERQLQAVVKDALGNVLPGRALQWSVDNANATISTAGLVRGLRTGYVTIIATSEGVSSAVAGTIVDPAAYDFDLVYYRRIGGGASELFVLPLGAGLAPVRLNAGTVSRTPSPSPDGLRIAFAVSMNEPTGERVDDIFAVDRSGLNMKRLTASEGYDDQPAWSPLGGRIAYHHFTFNGRSDIWIMNDDGSGQHSLTGDMSANGYRSSPAWSRDGSHIAFAQLESGPNGTTASIWTMQADGTNKRQLTSTLSGFDATPSWSPDGSRIAFVRDFDSDADIVIVDVNGAGAATRIALTGQQAAPAWSPDGTLIAFTQNDGVTTNIYTMQPNGSRVRLRTMDPAWGGGFAPAWIRRPNE